MNSPRISQTADRTKAGPTLKPQRIVCAGEAFNAEQRFSQMPDWVAALPISGNAKIIYARLLRYAQKSGRAYPSYATLGEYVGLSERQAQRLCHELRDAGLINILRRRESKSQRNLPSVFEFIYRPEMGAVAADPRPDDLEEEPTDIYVGRSRPADEHGAEPTEICGAEPVDIGVRVREKGLRDKGKREKEPIQQQQQQLLAPQQALKPVAVAAAAVGVSRFPKTLERLRKNRFPTAKVGQKWERLCAESGFSDEDFGRVAHGLDWVEFFGKGATSPIPVIDEAIMWLDRQRSHQQAEAEPIADEHLDDEARGVVYPNPYDDADPCKCGEWGLLVVDGEPRCATCNALRDDLPQSDKWRLQGLCYHCGCDNWHPLDEYSALCANCDTYKPVDRSEITERLYRTAKLLHCTDDEFDMPDRSAAGPCSVCDGEWVLKFETGVTNCARCRIDDLASLNRELLLDYVQMDPQVTELARSAIRRPLQAAQAVAPCERRYEDEARGVPAQELWKAAKIHHVCDDELANVHGSCSACGGEWFILFEDGTTACAYCCLGDLYRFNKPLLREYERLAKRQDQQNEKQAAVWGDAPYLRAMKLAELERAHTHEAAPKGLGQPISR